MKRHFRSISIAVATAAVFVSTACGAGDDDRGTARAVSTGGQGQEQPASGETFLYKSVCELIPTDLLEQVADDLDGGTESTKENGGQELSICTFKSESSRSWVKLQIRIVPEDAADWAFILSGTTLEHISGLGDDAYYAEEQDELTLFYQDAIIELELNENSGGAETTLAIGRSIMDRTGWTQPERPALEPCDLVSGDGLSGLYGELSDGEMNNWLSDFGAVASCTFATELPPGQLEVSVVENVTAEQISEWVTAESANDNRLTTLSGFGDAAYYSSESGVLIRTGTTLIIIEDTTGTARNPEEALTTVAGLISANFS